ncbi:MAG: hypothetical protein ABFS19_03870 [Thermodesulfobacteriota bacterium]
MMRCFFSIVTAGFLVTGCVAGKDTGSGSTEAITDVQYLSMADLKPLHEGRIQHWQKLKNDRAGSTLFRADGTHYKMGAWRVTEEGMKCTKRKGKDERCHRTYRDGESYVGVTADGNKLYTFTAKNSDSGEPVVITPDGGKALSAEQVKKLYTGSTMSWTNLNDGKEGKSIYFADDRYASSRGTWEVTDDGRRCLTQSRNNKTYCSRIYKEGDHYVIVSSENNKKIYTFTLE